MTSVKKKKEKISSEKKKNHVVAQRVRVCAVTQSGLSKGIEGRVWKEKSRKGLKRTNRSSTS